MTHNWRTPLVIIVAGALLVNFSMGIRHGMGLFLTPMTADAQMTRQAFSLAIAVQNICWGISSPFLGMFADRYGAGRVAALTCVLYALGLLGMEMASTPLLLLLTGGVMIGVAQGGCTVAVVSGVVGRAVEPAQRQQALAISGALGACGQFYLTPALQWLIGDLGWRASLMGAAARAPRRRTASRRWRRSAKPWASAASSCCAWATSCAACRWCSSACTCLLTCATTA
jgi:MFS family permease